MANIAAINCHSSFLPDYKGASAYKHAWANGEPFTGTTIHFLTENFDEGNIIYQEKIKIRLFDTPKSLLEKIAHKTGELLPLAIQKINNGDLGFSQGALGGRYFYKLSNSKFLFFRLVNIFIKPLGFTLNTKHKIL